VAGERASFLGVVVWCVWMELPRKDFLNLKGRTRYNLLNFSFLFVPVNLECVCVWVILFLLSAAQFCRFAFE
jgi:hypothetical protein